MSAISPDTVASGPEPSIQPMVLPPESLLEVQQFTNPKPQTNLPEWTDTGEMFDGGDNGTQKSGTRIVTIPGQHLTKNQPNNALDVAVTVATQPSAKGKVSGGMWVDGDHTNRLTETFSRRPLDDAMSRLDDEMGHTRTMPAILTAENIKHRSPLNLFLNTEPFITSSLILIRNKQNKVVAEFPKEKFNVFVNEQPPTATFSPTEDPKAFFLEIDGNDGQYIDLLDRAQSAAYQHLSEARSDLLEHTQDRIKARVAAEFRLRLDKELQVLEQAEQYQDIAEEARLQVVHKVYQELDERIKRMLQAQDFQPTGKPGRQPSVLKFLGVPESRTWFLQQTEVVRRGLKAHFDEMPDILHDLYLQELNRQHEQSTQRIMESTFTQSQAEDLMAPLPDNAVAGERRGLFGVLKTAYDARQRLYQLFFSEQLLPSDIPVDERFVATTRTTAELYAHYSELTFHDEQVRSQAIAIGREISEILGWASMKFEKSEKKRINEISKQLISVDGVFQGLTDEDPAFIETIEEILTSALDRMHPDDPHRNGIKEVLTKLQDGTYTQDLYILVSREPTQDISESELMMAAYSAGQSDRLAYYLSRFRNPTKKPQRMGVATESPVPEDLLEEIQQNRQLLFAQFLEERKGIRSAITRCLQSAQVPQRSIDQISDQDLDQIMNKILLARLDRAAGPTNSIQAIDQVYQSLSV